MTPSPCTNCMPTEHAMIVMIPRPKAAQRSQNSLSLSGSAGWTKGLLAKNQIAMQLQS
jgi:hypothetical protein